MGCIKLEILENYAQYEVFHCIVSNTGSNMYTQTQCTAYDPWGKRRNPNDWSYNNVPNTYMFDRGYTGHEMLDAFGLINMNGRVYDPLIARFLSPDNYVQLPDNTQGFNRYSYCLNNPLKYIDPTGEKLWHWLLGDFLTGGLISSTVSYVGISSYATYFPFSNANYELQKYVSPIAFNVNFNFGTHQKSIGFDVTYGLSKLSPYSIRWHQGSSYYWRNYGGYKGYEHRKGSEQSILGFYHWGKTHYEAGEFTQTVGYKSYGIPSLLGVDVSNDLWGDGGDRFRTSHQRINFLGLYIGGTVFTGDPGPKGKRETEIINGKKTYVKNPYGHDPDKYRHGLLYAGLGPIKIGWDSECIRHTLQNIIGHNWISPESPWFKYIKYRPKPYIQFGWDGLW